MDPGPAILWGVILILNLFTLSTENKSWIIHYGEYDLSFKDVEFT